MEAAQTKCDSCKKPVRGAPRRSSPSHASACIEPERSLGLLVLRMPGAMGIPFHPSSPLREVLRAAELLLLLARVRPPRRSQSYA
eukprot:8313905-Heterocapsa_arctica.AAC.1